jgi:hypothetical protein
MSETSPNLALPYLLAAQAQKHVTLNEALRMLDGLVQLSVVEARASPPASPSTGARYLVAATASGLWAGWEGSIALFDDNAWRRLIPQEGWLLWDNGAAAMLRFDGTTWLTLPLIDDYGSGEIEALGIATGADAINRLAVAAPATLLTHAGAGHQLKVNKAAAGDTGSILFQTGWSGRAEMGLASEDDFSFKVSGDGAAWLTALRILAATGLVELPNGAQVDGHAVLHRGSILGQVSQTSGVPTGAVIESGSNSNGQYVRFADGTQIAAHNFPLGSIVANGAGTFDNPFRTNTSSWVYPAAFSAAPQIALQSFTASSVAERRSCIVVSGTSSATELLDIQAFRMSATSFDNGVSARCVAIGRWYQ